MLSNRYGLVISEEDGFRVLGSQAVVSVLAGKFPADDAGLPALQSTLLRPAGVSTEQPRSPTENQSFRS